MTGANFLGVATEGIESPTGHQVLLGHQPIYILVTSEQGDKLAWLCLTVPTHNPLVLSSQAKKLRVPGLQFCTQDL